ncbi:hypothetical protein GCM10010321_43910 [Streptomyces chartreusis]|nr:hypothetical protein GCM10010321_43910 [Streptomyces chartreusis]
MRPLAEPLAQGLGGVVRLLAAALVGQGFEAGVRQEAPVLVWAVSARLRSYSAVRHWSSVR